MGQCDPPAFLGITVHGIKSKIAFASRNFMELLCVVLTNVEKFGQRNLISRQKKSIKKQKIDQNDPFRRSSVKRTYVYLILYFQPLTGCARSYAPLRLSYLEGDSKAIPSFSAENTSPSFISTPYSIIFNRSPAEHFFIVTVLFCHIYFVLTKSRWYQSFL